MPELRTFFAGEVLADGQLDRRLARLVAHYNTRLAEYAARAGAWPPSHADLGRAAGHGSLVKEIGHDLFRQHAALERLLDAVPRLGRRCVCPLPGPACEEVEIVVRRCGTAAHVHSDAATAVSRELGALTITRASHVEPDERGWWTADMSPSRGPVLGPYPPHQRGQALAAEAAWLREHRLGITDAIHARP